MELTEFKATLKPHTAIMGFDYGEKRLGIAVSDPLWLVATAQKIIFRTSLCQDIAVIGEMVDERQIVAFIYGLPRQMDGTEGSTAAAVRNFAAEVFKKIPLPYAFWDERLSSRAMENFLIKEADLSRARRKQVLDSSSAAYILQGALDWLKR